MTGAEAMRERLRNQKREFPTLEPRPGQQYIHVEDAEVFTVSEVRRALTIAGCETCGTTWPEMFPFMVRDELWEEVVEDEGSHLCQIGPCCVSVCRWRPNKASPWKWRISQIFGRNVTDSPDWDTPEEAKHAALLLGKRYAEAVKRWFDEYELVRGD